MSSPFGDGNGTRGGCRLGCLLAVASVLVVLVLAALAVMAVQAVA